MVFTPSKGSLEFPPLLDFLPEEERWPLPPFAWDHEAIDEHAFQPCELELVNGSTVAGELLAFEPLAARLQFRRDAAGAAVAVPFDKLRRVDLTVPLEPQRHARCMPVAENEREYRVTRTDGSTVVGLTVGRVETSFGVFLFPPVDVDRTVTRRFVPRGAYRSVEFGATAVEQATGAWIDDRDELLAAIAQQPHAPVLPMGRALLDLGLVTPLQIERALAQQAADRDKPLGQLLVDTGVVAAVDLEAALAHKMGYPLVDVERFPIEPAALRKLPVRTVLAMQALPLLVDGKRLIVAVASPARIPSLAMLRALADVTPVAVLARRTELGLKLASLVQQDVWAPVVPADVPAPDTQS